MKILIAEDHPASRGLLAKTLRDEGHEVVETANGSEAWDALNKPDAPRLAILDWLMPEMDGIELCKAIRKDDSNGYVFVIILTVKGAREDIIEGLEAGADDYMTKPFDRLELNARIQNGIRILELEENLRILSVTDPLTGIYNRGYLTNHLPQEIKRARRYDHPLSFVLCDIDDFKKVNDTYGHLVGDRVLVEVAQRIFRSIREDVDWVVRYGGEEFMVVLPETHRVEALVVAGNLRKTISQNPIKVQGKGVSITASYGVTGFDAKTPDNRISPEKMIAVADRCLYLAKREGGNEIKVQEV